MRHLEMFRVSGGRLLLAALSVLFWAAPVSLAEMVIENEYLRVTVSRERASFEITAKERRQVVVRQARFPGGIKAVNPGGVIDPVWGMGQRILIGHENGWSTNLYLYEGSRFVQIHTSVLNKGDRPYVAASEEMLEFEVDLDLPAGRLKSFGTGFLHEVDAAPGSFSFTAVVDPKTRNGVVAAYLTHELGSGVFFTDVRDGQPHVKTRLDFGRYQVDAGQSRKTETLLIGYFDDARFGLEAYADAVAKHYAIELKPEPSVYCTWYHGGASNEQKLSANGEFAREHLKPFGFSVVQIDDKWQAPFANENTYDESQKNFKTVGPIKAFFESNSSYPKGMRYTAEKLRGMGLVGGIWFMPFAGTWNNPYFADKQDMFAHWPDGSAVVTRWSGSLLDMSNPKTQDFVRQRTKRIADWGYDYFKLDGMHTGAVTHNVYVNTGYSTEGRWLNSRNFAGDKEAGPGGADVGEASTVLSDPRMTHIEAYRKGLEIVREAAPGVFILGCNISQNMRSMGAAFGLIDAMRIGPDNGKAGIGQFASVTKGPHHGSNLYFLNGRVWHNDPDPIYVRPSNPLHKARLMASWVAISGTMLTTSYQFADLPAERLDILKRVMPGHDAISRPVDLFESSTPRIWLLSDASRSVRRNVIGLFNWKESEPDTITCDMGRLGLDAETTYAGFDYWADEFVEPIRGTLDEELEGGTCRILAVRPVADHPQVLSTSRHITQGVIDMLDERWDEDKRILSGRSLVVGGDPYELRIAIPEGVAWQVGDVRASGAEIKVAKADKRGVRVVIESPQSRQVNWEIKWSGKDLW